MKELEKLYKELDKGDVMKTRAYELTIIFHPNLEDSMDKELEKVKKIIEKYGGKITKAELDGKKRLAYAIRGEEFGIYYYFDLEMPEDVVMRVNRELNIWDDVMRFLLVPARENR